MPELTMNVRIEPEDIANRVLDELEYKGKTIREWADGLANPRTKADCIRAMSDEELAKWLYNVCCIEEPFECPALSHPQKNVDCRKIWLDWLKSPAEGIE
jgi:hypothetical protein